MHGWCWGRPEGDVEARHPVAARLEPARGARVRGESREDSDYDILVIVAKPPTFREKVEVSEKIRDRLVAEMSKPRRLNRKAPTQP